MKSMAEVSQLDDCQLSSVILDKRRMETNLCQSLEIHICIYRKRLKQTLGFKIFEHYNYITHLIPRELLN